MKTFQQFNEDAASQYRAGQLAYQSSAPARLSSRRGESAHKAKTLASDFVSKSKQNMKSQRERLAQMKDDHEERKRNK